MSQLMESLESRQLLAAGVWSSDQFHVTKRGTLVVKGTDAADSLAVIRQGATVTLYGDPENPQVVMSFTDGSVKRLLVEANAGDDIIEASGFDHPETIAGGAGDDRLWGGRGATLIGGGGDDTLMCGGNYSLPAVDDTTGIGDLIDKTPSLLSGGAGRDTLVATIGAPDSLVGGTGVDRLFCTAKFEGAAPTGSTAADLLIQQDAVTLSGMEHFELSERKAIAQRPPGSPNFNSPFGVFGAIAGGKVGWLKLSA